MISLILSLAVLLIGYLVYSRVVDRVFAPDERQTPAVAVNDGVDCVPMKPWKAYLVQLLNLLYFVHALLLVEYIPLIHHLETFLNFIF